MYTALVRYGEENNHCNVPHHIGFTLDEGIQLRIYQVLDYYIVWNCCFNNFLLLFIYELMCVFMWDLRSNRYRTN